MPKRPPIQACLQGVPVWRRSDHLIFLRGYFVMQSTCVSKGSMYGAIIVDGNGRWAKWRLLPRTVGHRAGVTASSRSCSRRLFVATCHSAGCLDSCCCPLLGGSRRSAIDACGRPASPPMRSLAIGVTSSRRCLDDRPGRRCRRIFAACWR